MAVSAINGVGGADGANRILQIISDSRSRISKNLSRIGSGSRIISPEDDAAGLAQVTKFNAQIERLNAAQTNITDSISFSETQSGVLTVDQKILGRMGELAMLAQDATRSDADRALYQNEFSQLQEIISDSTGSKFNEQPIFSESGHTVTTDGEGGTTTAAPVDLDSPLANGGVGGVESLSISTAADAAAALDSLLTATGNVARLQSSAGANISSLNFRREALEESELNISAARSRIADSDLAEESTKLSANLVRIRQAYQLLGKANQNSFSALS